MLRVAPNPPGWDFQYGQVLLIGAKPDTADFFVYHKRKTI